MILKKVKDGLNSSLVSNFFSLLILQGSNYLFPLLTIPYLYSNIGLEKFGLINFATAFVQYFAVFTDFGFNLSATKYISENREDKKNISLYFNSVIVTKILLFLIGLLFLLVIINLFDKFSSNKYIYILSYGSVLGSVLLPTWFFQGMEQMRYITRITIVTRILSIIPIFIFVKSDDDFILVPFFYSLGSIVSGILGLVVANSKFKVSISVFEISFFNVLTTLRGSVIYFMSRISVSLYTISNTFILGIVFGNVTVGYYVAAEKLYSALQSFYYPLSNALYPYIARKKSIVEFKKIFVPIVILNIIGVIIFISYSDYFMNLIYTDIPNQSIKVSQILFFVCIINVPSVLLGYPLLGALGYTKYTNWTVVVSSIFHVIGLLVLFITSYLNIYSVAFMVLATEGLVLVLRVIGVKKYISEC